MHGSKRELRRDLQNQIEALGVERRVAAQVAQLCGAEVARRVRDVLSALVRALATPRELRRLREANRKDER